MPGKYNEKQEFKELQKTALLGTTRTPESTSIKLYIQHGK